MGTGAPKFSKIVQKAVQNVENRMVWVVRGHSGSLAMSQNHIARTTSYSPFVETMDLSSLFEISELLAELVADTLVPLGRSGIS